MRMRDIMNMVETAAPWYSVENHQGNEKFADAAVAFFKAHEADRLADPTKLWHATVDRLEAGYYIDDIVARSWKQVPAGDAISIALDAIKSHRETR